MIEERDDREFLKNDAAARERHRLRGITEQ
jgi:hypothetical protein